MRKEYDFSKAKRGAVIKSPATKTRITIRLDNEVIAWFKKQVHNSDGGSYQALINKVLRDHVKRKPERIETTIRRVLREELHRVS